MSLLKRVHDALARRSLWILTALSILLTIVGAWVARLEHMPDECLPARCTIRGTDAARAGASTWTPYLRFEAVSEKDEHVGNYWMTLDAKAGSRARAIELAQERWDREPGFACYYHPVYRDYVTLRASGHWGVPLAVAIVGFLFSLLMVASMWLYLNERPRPDGRRVYSFGGRDAWERLFRARDFLPEDPPPGWSTFYQLRRDPDAWGIDVGDEGLLVRMDRVGPFWVVRATVTTRGAKHMPEPKLPSDARCAEILGRLQGVGEWLECDPGELSATRSWAAFPRAQRPRFRVAEGVSWPPEPTMKPPLAAARAHLPEKLPPGWSLPVALTDDHGTAWKEGGWLIAVDETLMALVNLCTIDGREQLVVTLFHRDGDDVRDAEAVDVLRHFRGVHEFSQGKRPAGAPFVTYLGELGARPRERATLN